MITTTVFHSRHCSGSSDCAGDKPGWHADGMGREGSQSMHHIQEQGWTRVSSCRDCHQMDLHASDHQYDHQDIPEPSATNILFLKSHVWKFSPFYLVLDSMNSFNVFLQVAVVIKCHATLITHNIFGFQMNFVNMLT